jgi:hypothetical protein
LGQLVLLTADGDGEARQEVFGRLLCSKVGIKLENPHRTFPAGTWVTTANDPIEIPSTRGSDGHLYLSIYADVPVMWAAFPDEAIGEIDARVILKMARDNGMGIIIHYRSSDQDAQFAVPRECINDILEGAYSKTVVVPAGHKVVVIEPTPLPKVAQCESKIWVVELGSGIGCGAVMARVREIVTDGNAREFLWIFQPMVLNRPEVFDAAVSEIVPIVNQSRNIRHVAVAPYGTKQQEPMMKRLQQLGMEVYLGGPHGECLIEVHKPDGIVVYMPGRKFAGSA